jgi:thymidylate kinase
LPQTITTPMRACASHPSSTPPDSRACRQIADPTLRYVSRQSPALWDRHDQLDFKKEEAASLLGAYVSAEPQVENSALAPLEELARAVVQEDPDLGALATQPSKKAKRRGAGRAAERAAADAEDKLLKAPIDESPRVLVLWVEANIGAGKSSALHAIANQFEGDARVQVLQEPVDDWRESGALAGLYDGTVSTLAFQLLALLTFKLPVFRALREALDQPGVRVLVVERSLRSQRDVFAALNLTEAEQKIYELPHVGVDSELRQLLQPGKAREATALLEVDVDTLMARIKTRGRPEEQAIPRDFHERLSKQHQVLWAARKAERGHDVHRIDASQSAKAVADKMIGLVLAYLEGMDRPEGGN